MNGLPGVLAALGLVLAAQPAAAEAGLALPSGIIELDGRPAPALRLETTDGVTVDLRSLRGRWVFVHFWASWCGPCRREMPAVERMAAALARERLELVLVNTAEREDEVWAFLGVVAPSLPSALDLDGQVTERWQPRGLPSTFLVDPQGRLRYLALGGRPWDTGPYRAFLEAVTASAQGPGSG